MRPQSRQTPRRRRGGLTLIETMLAMVVLSLAVFGLLSTLLAGEQQLQEADHAMAASRLARDLLEEILGKAYEDPQAPGNGLGPDSGERDRTLFDDCDDFNNYKEDPGSASNAAGVLYPPNQQVFSRRVKVSRDTVTIAGVGAAVPGVTVQVTVEDKFKRTWNYTRFIPQPP
jgi:type II secretory pathway pseudopilin PulG